MKRRRWKSFDYLPNSQLMRIAKTPLPIYGPFSKSARNERNIASQARQTAAALIEASRIGILDLVECILRGWTYELDESGRLWVYHPDVVVE